jgi:hypothetical protein
MMRFWACALLVTLFGLTACFEPREGCLDIEAVNFDVAADKECCCCCTYPRLRLRYRPLFDSLVWKPDTAYEYAPGRWFRLRQVVFYLSAFEFVQDGRTYTVLDTLSLAVQTPGGDTVLERFTNDFLLIRRTVADYPVGEFRQAGNFSSVRFQVGLPPAAQHVIPNRAPENHPLRPQPENLWLGPGRGFAALQLILTRDTLPTTPPDTLVFGPPDFPAQTLLSPGPFSHESGYDFDVELRVDFRKFFRSVDLTTSDIPAWKAQIWNNLPNAMGVIPK